MSRSQVLTFEQFAAQNNASAQGFGDAALHRSSERISEKSWQRMLERQRQLDEALYLRRAELKRVYADKVAAGDIRPPSLRERTIAIASGNPELPSTQAARRLVERLYGGAGLGGEA